MAGELSQAPPIRVCIAARVRMYRDGLAAELAADRRFDVVASAHDWDSCLEAVRACAPDVVVLDTSLPSSLARVAELHAQAPGVRVLGLAVASVEDALACAEAGIAGYITRDDSLTELAGRIEGLCRDEMPCSPQVAGRLLARVAELARANGHAHAAARLTSREREVASLIDEGLSNKQIAGRLQIEVATVKNHVHNILDKLGAQRRGEVSRRVRI